MYDAVPWTDEQTNVLISMTLAGATDGVIGLKLNRSLEAVRQKRRRLRAAGRLPPAEDRSWSREELDRLAPYLRRPLPAHDLSVLFPFRTMLAVRSQLQRLRRAAAAAASPPAAPHPRANTPRRSRGGMNDRDLATVGRHA